MAVTLINWIYIFITVFLTGFALSRLIKKLFGTELKGIDEVMVTGFVFTGVYAGYFSIFSGLSAAANIILVLLCLLSSFFYRRELNAYIRDKWPVIKKNIPLLVMLAIVLAAVSADVPHDYDTYLYHSQAVQWIEKYGVVPGLANLHNRFGYNSSFMCLQALYSFSFMGRSLHELNGFICLFMAVFACCRADTFSIASLKASDMLKLTGLFYILYAFRSISSPGSDIMPMLLLIWLFAKWCMLYEREEADTARYALLVMLSVYLCTVKLSVLPAVLLLCYPVYFYIKKKNIRHIIFFVITALTLFLPYIIRNVIITGYLLYPMESIDIFNFDWKLSPQLSAFDRGEIVAFGRGVMGEDNAGSLISWVQIWFRKLEFIPRLLVCLTGFSCIAFVTGLIRTVRKKDVKYYEKCFLSAVSFISMVYWLLSSPLMRYGIVVLMIFNVLVIAAFCEGSGIKAYKVFLMACMLFIFVTNVAEYEGKEINLIYPEDYSSFECKEVILKGPSKEIAVYTPLEGDQTGYDVFPASPEINPDYTELRGDSLKEGFRPRR